MRYTFDSKVTTATTIKRWLAKQGVSHRLFKKMLANHLLWLDGHRTGNTAIQAGQMVRFAIPTTMTVTPEKASLDVLYEDQNWLIINKPAHLTSVPGPHDPHHSLLNRIVWYLQQQKVTEPQPAIITRLDRDTVGLVLAAKHPYAQGRFDQAHHATLKKNIWLWLPGTSVMLPRQLKHPLVWDRMAFIGWLRKTDNRPSRSIKC